jgi:peptide deformylase
MANIVQEGDPVLRKKAVEVAVSNIGKPKIKKIIKDMEEALHLQDDGVAIAAPQIAVPLRIFIVSGRVFDEDFIRGRIPKLDEASKKIRHPDLVFINPVIKKISRDRKLMLEGCLSVRPLYGKVRRATRLTIEAYNEHGNKISRDGSGLLAHIFQHEIDHLEGILFIDKAKDLHESTSEQEFN